MAQNQTPGITAYCADLPNFTPPIIRLYGGGVLSTQIDASKGVPGECADVFSIINKIEPALAALQPVLTALDAVAQIGFCLQLAIEAQTNPLKIIDLLKCVPDLVAKINAVLALVPPFPQGIAQIVTMIIDVISTVAHIIKCLVNQLTVLSNELQQISDLQARAQNATNADLRANLLTLAGCAQRNSQAQLTSSLAALGPIARVLCVVKTMLVNTGSDACKQAAKLLTFPDPSQISAVNDAITFLSATGTALSLTVTVLQSILGPIGIAPPPPNPAFTCPIDQILNAQTTPPPPPPTPNIQTVQVGVTGTPTITPSIPHGNADTTIILNGTGFVASSTVYVGSSKLANVTLEGAGSVLVAVVPATLLKTATTFQLSVVNPATQTQASDSGPFSLQVPKQPFSALNNPIVNSAGQQTGTASTQNQSSNQIPLQIT